MFTTIVPGQIPTGKLHAYLLGGVAPRPIALVSTIDRDGKVNLSPFSFFNVFGSNPPIAIISPARRVRDNTTKHTLENAMATGELVINAVNFSMVQQTSLSSVEYPAGIDEFTKAGFNSLASEVVKPPRVLESPFQLECMVSQVVHTGSEGGAGNLIFAHILRVHVRTDVLDAQANIDPHLIDLVGRLGGDAYVRASGDALFMVPKPVNGIGIGIDALPEAIRFAPQLSGNHLGRLGNVLSWPTRHDSEHFWTTEEGRLLLQDSGFLSEADVYTQAKAWLDRDLLWPAIHWLNTQLDA
jgi:flavin reductase (DIM6/NTAB) family NADH-FMN oxidoreductase RutF